MTDAKNDKDKEARALLSFFGTAEIVDLTRPHPFTDDDIDLAVSAGYATRYQFDCLSPIDELRLTAKGRACLGTLPRRSLLSRLTDLFRR